MRRIYSGIGVITVLSDIVRRPVRRRGGVNKLAECHLLTQVSAVGHCLAGGDLQKTVCYKAGGDPIGQRSDDITHRKQLEFEGTAHPLELFQRAPAGADAPLV